MAKKVFITGATGMLGTLLVEQILETQSNWETYLLYRSEKNLEVIKKIIAKIGSNRGNTIQFIKGDILDKTLKHIVPDNLDVLFHMAAATSMWSAENDTLTKVNVDGTSNIIDFCLEKGVQKLVFTSSIAAYSPPHGSFVNESAPKLGELHLSFYNKTKARAEQLVLTAVQEKGLKACILNPCQVLGKYDSSSWAQLFHAVMSKELTVMGKGSGCFANGTEVAKAHIAAAERGKIGHNYILGGPSKPYIDVCAEISKLKGETSMIKVIPDFVVKSVATTMNWYSYYWTGTKPFITPEVADRLTRSYTVDSSKAREELGYDDNVPFEQSVREEYDWVARHQV